jgi:hypothetical protein
LISECNARQQQSPAQRGASTWKKQEIAAFVMSHACIRCYIAEIRTVSGCFALAAARCNRMCSVPAASDGAFTCARQRFARISIECGPATVHVFSWFCQH